MSPTLSDGDYVITVKPRRPSPGLIYVINHGDLGPIVKRLSKIDDGRAIVIGDNPASTPSSVMAPIELKRLTGRVILAITKQGLKKL